ncbi:MAG: DUF2851 family protein [Candidatus Limimorpha sp.]
MEAIEVMKEEFLCYIWENRLLKGRLVTTDGVEIEIVNAGYRNSNSGPDFLEAQIRIGTTLWAGNVEIHVKTSDWNRHQHQQDKAYGNVVLHVVYEHDSATPDLPTLVLNGHFDESLYDEYQSFIHAKGWIPCEKSVASVQTFTWLSWLDRMVAERLERKAVSVVKLLNANKNDWEDAFYKLMLHYLGLKVNNEAFEYLSSILSYRTLQKHSDNLLQVEAMLFGCAGLLDRDFTDEYPLLLQREFAAMKAKFGLLTMPAERWKFMRMRPGNFPTLRLSQIAQIVHRSGNLFSKIKEAESVEALRALFDVPASGYWNTHYRFESVSRSRPKHLGETTSDVLIVNAIVPLLFCYGRQHGAPSVCERAIGFLENTPAEDNTVTRHYAACGVAARNAMQSQAMLHLFECYCKRRQCLKCRIGSLLIKNG